MNKKELVKENEILKRACIDLSWMARRYADGRSSTAPEIYNSIVETLLAMGIHIKPDPIQANTVWAKDGGGRQFDHLHDDHMNDTPVGRGEVIWPRGTRLCDEIAEALGTTSPSAAALEIKRLKALETGVEKPVTKNNVLPKKRGRKPKNVNVD